jgi:hypothetical protein
MIKSRLPIWVLTEAGLPNTRLKLAAPRSCGKLAFVNATVRRRSLSAPR